MIDHSELCGCDHDCLLLSPCFFCAVPLVSSYTAVPKHPNRRWTGGSQSAVEICQFDQFFWLTLTTSDASLPRGCSQSCTHAETDQFQWFQGSFFKLRVLFLMITHRQVIFSLWFRGLLQLWGCPFGIEQTKPSAAVMLTFIGIFALKKNTKPCFLCTFDGSIYDSTYPFLGYTLVCSLLLLILATAAHSARTAMKTAENKNTFVSQSDPIPHDELHLRILLSAPRGAFANSSDWLDSWKTWFFIGFPSL